MELSTGTGTSPKLSLHSAPLHLPEPSGLATPPPSGVPVSVPFIWEEEPGRPRKKPVLDKPNQIPTSVMSLKLPPRMVAEELKTKAGIKNTSTSPTSVLDVPSTIRRSVSFSRCYSFRIGSEGSQGRRVNDAKIGDDILSHKEQSKELNEGNDSPMSSELYISCVCDEGKETRVKITRFKRHRSFIDVSMHTTSHFLIGIYKGPRQVVQWHRSRFISADMSYVKGNNEIKRVQAMTTSIEKKITSLV